MVKLIPVTDNKEEWTQFFTARARELAKNEIKSKSCNKVKIISPTIQSIYRAQSKLKRSAESDIKGTSKRVKNPKTDKQHKKKSHKKVKKIQHKTPTIFSKK